MEYKLVQMANLQLFENDWHNPQRLIQWFYFPRSPISCFQTKLSPPPTPPQSLVTPNFSQTRLTIYGFVKTVKKIKWIVINFYLEKEKKDGVLLFL